MCTFECKSVLISDVHVRIYIRACVYIQITRVPRRSQVIAVDPTARTPLKLANDDILYASDLIVKCSSDGSGGGGSEEVSL